MGKLPAVMCVITTPLSYLTLHTCAGAYNMVNQPTMITNNYGNMGHGPIRFYNRDEPYYEFTNFYPAPIDLDGKIWPTTEHYFQAQKFIGTSYPEVIRNFNRPRQAFDLSRNPTVSRWRRSDWEDIKISIMRKALLAKFTQHKHLRQMLLRTGDRHLIEHSPHDKFWGNGGDDSGENRLGMLLMEIRHDLKSLQASLRQENSPTQPCLNPDSHREHVQISRIDSTERDGQNGLSSASSCSMECTNAGDDESNRNNDSHQESTNRDGKNGDLTRRPLRSTATENTGSDQLLAAVGGEPVNTPAPATNTDKAPLQSASEPPVANLIDLDPEPPKKDKVTDIITGNVPLNLDIPLLPIPSMPSQSTAGHGLVGQCIMTQPPPINASKVDTSGTEPSLSNEDDQSEEKMDTDETTDV